MRFTKAMPLFAVGLALAAASAAAQAKAAAKSPAKAPAKREFEMVPAADLKWVSEPEVPAVQTAVVWGDPKKGAHGAFNKFPAGFEVPLHSHTHDAHVVVVSGTMIETPEGGAAKELGPGSYFFMPGGNRHTTACKAGSECVVYRSSAGIWDVKTAQAPAAKK